LDVWLLENCVCPVDHCELVREGNYLVSTRNPLRRYPIAYGIPVFLRDDDESTAWWALESLKRAGNIADGKVDSDYYDPGVDGVHPHVHGVIESTGGHLYEELKGRMVEYPIPQIRVDRPAVPSPLLLDGGCNWGRWTFSAARKGIPAIGVDPSLGAVIAARQIRRQLNLPCSFFVGDVRFLPFREGTFTNVFSYSVVQHFSKENARLAFGEFSRILQNRGECFVQMPNALGIRCLYHLARRRFHEGRNFDVRYYTLPELKRLLSGLFQVVELSLDAYLGLGIQPDDRKYMSWRNRLVIDVSEKLRVLQHLIPPLLYFADSIYVYGRKNV
jgi:SAM-dependent methyltransferase